MSRYIYHFLKIRIIKDGIYPGYTEEILGI
jgi:hypothetical protein